MKNIKDILSYNQKKLRGCDWGCLRDISHELFEPLRNSFPDILTDVGRDILKSVNLLNKPATTTTIL